MSEDRDNEREADVQASDPPNNTVADADLSSSEADGAAPSDPPNNT